MYIFLLSFTFFINFFASATGPFDTLPAPHTYGPNCWNGALVAQDILKTHRFTHPEEFNYLVEKNCVALNSPQFGALGRMSYEGNEVHAFIWIDEQTIYAKHSDGRFSNDKYELMNTERMLQSYKYNRSCRPTKTKSCENDIRFFHCEKPKGVLHEQITRLQKVELLVHELTFSNSTKMTNGDNCLSSGFLQRNLVLDQIEQQIMLLSANDILDIDYLMVWKKSIALQIRNSQSVVSALRCKNYPDIEKYAHYNKIIDALDIWLPPPKIRGQELN